MMTKLNLAHGIEEHTVIEMDAFYLFAAIALSAARENGMFGRDGRRRQPRLWEGREGGFS